MPSIYNNNNNNNNNDNLLAISVVNVKNGCVLRPYWKLTF